MRTLLAALAFAALSTAAHADTAIFAGGCFWCVESDFDHVKGVTETISGYAGGTEASPTYEGHEGYAEAVKVTFDPKVVSYPALVAHFLRTIDAVDDSGQFCDRGEEYAPYLYPIGAEQKAAAAQALKDAGAALGQPLKVKFGANQNFAAAEDYHQNYHMGQNLKLTRFGLVKQSSAYERYRKACGRDARVKALWGNAAYSFPAGGSS